MSNNMKECEYCKKEFKPKRKSQRFCSLRCANIVNGEKSKKFRKCKECGKPFHKPSMWGVVFCGDDCRHKYFERLREAKKEEKEKQKIEAHKKHCIICDEEFNAHYMSELCCSDECYKIYARVRSRKNSARKHKTIKIKCKNCKEEFDREYGDKRSVFCCIECAQNYRKKKDRKTDDYKIKKKEEHKRRKKHIIENFVEEVDYNKIYERDNGICQICGHKVLDKGVSDYWSGSIDHIIPLSLGGEHSMKNCQLTHRICNSIKLQNKEEFKIDWEEKSKTKNYWKKKFDEYKMLCGNEAGASHFSK